MEVVETIIVHSEGRNIQRGICRDILPPPNAVHRLDSVTRNGDQEPWHVENIANGKRYYFGKEYVLIPNAKNEYKIHYSIFPGLQSHTDNDPLYWNVTGNHWSFRIDRASAQVRLPEEIPTDAMQFTADTGLNGSRGTAVSVETNERRGIFFQTIDLLDPGEGLTIVVGVEPGYFKIKAPSLATKLTSQVQTIGILATDPSANFDAGLFLLRSIPWLAVPILYFIVAWLIIGVDPRRGTIFPSGNRPPDLSPATIRYITNMHYDSKTLAVALVNMIALGHIQITQKGKHYEIALGNTKRGGLTPEGKVVSKALGLRKNRIIQMTPTLGRQLRLANEHLMEYLEETCQKIYFLRNAKPWLGGVLLCTLALGIICL